MMPRICLLDPSITSRDGEISNNLGDLIIRQAVVRELRSMLPDWGLISLPTQLPLTADELQKAIGSELIVIGGTNLLSSHMKQYRQWQINSTEAALLHRVVLMGVGWWQYQDEPDAYTRSVLLSALSHELPHSVRDNYTLTKLAGLDLTNTTNTGCPTTWRLDGTLSKIPTEKADDVLLTLTDYNKNRPVDANLLDLLFSQYKNVYFWPQGHLDLKYVSEFARPLQVIDRTLGALEEVLQRDEPIDCIGTRLHGGVKCLENARRTMILGIDNRANEIAADTGLPVIQRENIDSLKRWIAGSKPVQMRINHTAINQWKKQLIESMSQTNLHRAA